MASQLSINHYLNGCGCSRVALSQPSSVHIALNSFVTAAKMATSCSLPFHVLQGYTKQHELCCRSVRDPSRSSLYCESGWLFGVGVKMQRSGIKEAVLVGRRDGGFSKAV